MDEYAVRWVLLVLNNLLFEAARAAVLAGINQRGWLLRDGWLRVDAQGECLQIFFSVLVVSLRNSVPKIVHTPTLAYITKKHRLLSFSLAPGLHCLYNLTSRE